MSDRAVPSDDNSPPAAHAAPDESSTSAVSTSALSTAPSSGGDGVVSEDQVKAALRKVKDPELNLNIVDLGLVYAIRVDGSAAEIDMSLTSPGCPSGPEIMTAAEEQMRAIPGVTQATVNLVWSPFWSPDRIEPRVRAYLGF